MKKGTKKVIIAIAIIVVIIILIITGLLLYLGTDLFKSNEEQFFKYFAQNEEIIQKLVENPNRANIQSVKQNNYTTTGNISFNLVSNDTQFANQSIPARNFSIDYTRQVNPR